MLKLRFPKNQFILKEGRGGGGLKEESFFVH